MPIAIFSVSNKSGVVKFAQGLLNLGWTFLGSGGTARAFREAGLPITDISEITSSPEILDGRVKTIHPVIAGGILARSTIADAEDLKKIKAEYIDLVVCNLYPFKQTIEKPNSELKDAIENIDIGGVTLIRAAAKNFERVAVIVEPFDYSLVLDELETLGSVSLGTRRILANKAFSHTAEYDSTIYEYLNKSI